MPMGTSSTRKAAAESANKNGMPNAAYSGTALATAPCELALMSSAPVRMPACSASMLIPCWIPRIPPTPSSVKPYPSCTDGNSV